MKTGLEFGTGLKMDWNKINISEVKSYCTASGIDFDCLPFSIQLGGVIEILYYYEISLFRIEDIKDFYNELKIANPRSDGIRKPSTRQIVNALEKMSNIQFVGDESYHIIRADTSIFIKEIMHGYDEKRIG